MKKWSKAYTLIFVLLFVQAIVACGFRPQAGEDEQATATVPAPVDEVGGATDTPNPTATAPQLPTQTAEPTDEPVGEAAILTSIAEAGEPAPRLIGRNPAGTDTLGLDESLELYFDQPMDPDTTAAAFQFISADGDPIAGSVDWPQPRVMRFTPEQVLTTGSQYSVILSESAQSTSGMTLVEAVSLDLFTIGDIEVSSVSPANGVTEVASDSAVTVIFSRPVVPLVNAEAQDELPSPITISPETPGTGEWINTSVYIWRPSVPLAGKGTYQATVLADVVNGVSASGAQLAEDYSWSFTIAAPTISNLTLPGLSRYVGDSYSEFPPNQTLLVTFNQPMDEITTRNAISLVRDDGAAVPLDYVWNDIQTAITLTPTQSLSFDSSYTFTVQDTAQSAAGGELRFGKVLRINTVALPAISFTEPADGSTQREFSSGFSIYFETEMDESSLDGKVIIEPPITGDPNGQYNRWRRAISFWGLSPATDYTVTILPGMSDPYGNVLTETQTFTFRTANRDPFIALEMNFPFAIYRYNGSPDMWVRNINVADYQLNVYALDDYRDFFRMVDRYDTRNHNPEGDTLIQFDTGTGEPESNKTNYSRYELRDTNGNYYLPGFYYVTLNSGSVNNRNGRHDDARPIMIANANLTLKTTADEAFMWLTSLESGAPIDGVEIVLLDESFNEVKRGRTDEDGRLKLTDIELETGWGGTYYAITNSSEYQAAAITNWNEGVSPWDFGIRADYYSYNNNLRGYIYTDRPLYRPDQTVFIKGIVRLDDDLNYAIPQNVDELFLEIYNFEGEVYRDQITLNGMGSFELELELDSEAVLGDYSIQLSHGRGNNREWVGSGIFSVAEYRKPTFKVDVETPSENFVDGDRVDATIKAEFFSGGGVANSDLTWSLTGQNTTFQPTDPNLSRYSFNTAERDRRFYFDPYDEFSRGQVIASGAGTTNGSGEFTIDLAAELESETGTRRMTLETVVTDLAGNVVAGRSTYTIHPGSQYAGIKAAQYIGLVDEPMGLDLVVINLNSQVIPNALVDIEVVKRNWFSVQEDDGNGGLVWKSTVEEVPIAEISGVSMDQFGRGVAEFIPTEGGTYRAYARTTDPNGKEITTSTFFWVSGGNYIPWRRINDHSFELIPDADQYSPGDTAKLLIASPFQGISYALITVERGSIYESQVIELSSNSTIYELPITPQMAPNVYVSVMVMKGVDEFSDHPDFKVGYAQFNVDREQQELNIEIVPDQTKLGPRDTVKYDITVTDANGAPVEAELSLALVDLAVLSLKKEQIPNMLDYFYSERSLSVATALLLTKEMDSYNAEVEEEAKGGGGGFGEQGVASVREIFKDTAYWSAVIMTDGNGKATAEVTLPDNLTTWRLDARAITADTKVGQATNDIVSTRPLLVSPQTPRFFIINDEVTLGTVVRNTTDNQIEAAVSISATGVDLLDPAEQLVTIPASGQAFVTWNVRVFDTNRVDLIFQAEGGGYSDASRPTLGTLDNQGIPVYKYEVFETVGTSGQLLDGGVVVESIGLPIYPDSSYVPSQGEVTIELAPSLAAAMTTGLNYLEHYEFECTEQVVSKFLPNVLTTQAMKNAGISDPELEANLERQVNVALQKIYSRQRPNGGWPWWDNPRSQTNTLVSAYVVLSLIEAQEAGYDVRPEVVSRGIAYLRDKVSQGDGLNGRVRFNRQAFVLYVLTLGGSYDPNLAENLFKQRENMDLYAKAYLTRALHITDPTDPRLETLIADFTTAATFSATGTSWEESRGYDYYNWNSDTRTTAIVMGTLAKIDPENPLVANSVRWLMNHRTNGRWGGTQATAWTLMALTDWMVESDELKANYDFEVALNGELLAQGLGSPETIRETTTVEKPVTDLNPTELNKLAIGRTAGDGNLYYTAHVKVGLPVPEIQARDDGIVISRSYFDPSDPATPITEAVVGDTVMVRLSIVAPRTLHYVGIVDWLPAGLEPIDTTLETAVQNDPINQEQGGQRTDRQPSYYNYYTRGYGWWYFQHAQRRDEKVELSSSWLPKGTYEYVYLARAATPGKFNVIPPQAEQFYHPEVTGRGAGMQFTVHPVGTTLTKETVETEPIRIQFAPGAVSGEIDGFIESGQTATYVLGAAAGQTMTVQAISPNSDVVFGVQAPDGSTIGTVTADSPAWVGQLPADGDYEIMLSTPGNGTGYLLQVTIE